MDTLLLPPANEVCAGYVFTRVCHSVHGGGGLGPGWRLRGLARDGGVCVCRPSPGGGGVSQHALRQTSPALECILVLFNFGFMNPVTNFALKLFILQAFQNVLVWF